MSTETIGNNQAFSLEAITGLQESMAPYFAYKGGQGGIEKPYDNSGQKNSDKFVSWRSLQASQTNIQSLMYDDIKLLDQSSALDRFGVAEGREDLQRYLELFNTEYGQKELDKYIEEKIDVFCRQKVSTELMQQTQGTLLDLKKDSARFSSLKKEKATEFSKEIDELKMKIRQMSRTDPEKLWKRIAWADQSVLSGENIGGGPIDKALVEKYNARTAKLMEEYGHILTDAGKDPLSGLYLNPMLKQSKNMELIYGRGVLGDYGLKEAIDLVVEDEDGNQLMFDRPRNEGIAYPGGMVDFGETPYEAMMREFTEEIGIDLQGAEPQLVGKYLVADSRNAALAWIGTNVFKLKITNAQRDKMIRALASSKEAINPRFISKIERIDPNVQKFASHGLIAQVAA